MSSVEFNRRNFLSTSFLAIGAVVTSGTGMAVENVSKDWAAALEESLRSYSSQLRRTVGSGGETELHCTMPDPFAFGSSSGNLAGLGLRVKAAGNRLSLERDGVTVHLFLLTDSSLTPSPATAA